MAEFIIQIVPFQDDWLVKYEDEKAQLCEVFKAIKHDIEHIGSTSVGGLDAKPIIDIAVRLETVCQVPEFIESLARRGYSYEGEFGLAGRHFFIKGTPRAFHLHLVDGSTNHWTRWIAFRDALRSDPQLRNDYQRLKYDLASKYRFERAKYSEGKSEFIDSRAKKHGGGDG